jgi:hypothetical protein
MSRVCIKHDGPTIRLGYVVHPQRGAQFYQNREANERMIIGMSPAEYGARFGY